MVRVLKQELVIRSKYYKEILSIIKLAGGVARIVGGSVRDAIYSKHNNIFNKANYDIDITTDLSPEQIINILSKSNIKSIPTGIKYGTVTALLGDEKFEITTLRKDIKCDGRHTEVIFTDNFEQDAIRRDFTINALNYCPSEGKIYDYVNGLEDLEQSRVIFIGQPAERIKEDFLRILRFFRFSCNYAKQLDPDGLSACIKLKDNLKSLSKERIKEEIDKLIISNNSPYILQKMFDNGILQTILPITQFNREALLQAINLASDFGTLEPYARYSLLFYHINDFRLSDLLNLKFSKQEAKKIIAIVKIINNINQISQYTLRKIWWENDNYLQYLIILVSLGRINFDIAKKFFNRYNLYQKPVFPLTGCDLQKNNIHGKAISILMDKLKKSWIENDFSLGKNQLLQLLETYREN